MKILHINTSQNGGAAWCAIRINKSLVNNGVDSRMLFAEGDSPCEDVDGAIAEKDSYLWGRNWLLLKIRHLINRIPWICDADKMKYDLCRALDAVDIPLYVHQPFSYYKNISHHPLVEWADIIHLHWVSGFVDYPSFFKEVKKPIVWTLHDKNPALGILHYSTYRSKLPTTTLVKLDKKCVEIKRKAIANAEHINVVAISTQMQIICSESKVLKGIPCSLIYNGVDTSIFHFSEFDKNVILQKYFNDKFESGRITLETKIFMFSSYDIWDNNKGLERVISALESIYSLSKVLIVVGNNNSHVNPSASFPIICTGLIRDQKELSYLYSISDFFVLASYEETFAQTSLEAMACGTPVISTPCSGAHDLIHSFNGVICKGFNSEYISGGIREIASRTFNRKAIRQYIIDNFDFSIIAGNYINLYKSLM